MQSKKLPIDYTIAFLLGCFLIISLVAIYSGSGQYASTDPTKFVERQLLWYIVGFIMMMVVAYFDFELIEKWTLALYILGMILLLAVEVIGVDKNGAQRWLDFKLLLVQPSEFMKFFLVFHIASLLAKLG